MDGFSITERVRSFFQACRSRCIGSQIVEGGFNGQKNSVPHENRNGAIETAFHTLFDKKVASKKHDYKGLTFPMFNYQRDLKANDWSARFADAVIIDHCVRFGCLGKIQHAWRGEMFMATSKLAVRCTLAGAATPWMLPLTHFSRSAGVAWPHKEHAVVNADVVFMQLSLGAVSIDELLRAVADPSNWEAIPVEWCSVFSRCLLLGAQLPRELPGGLGGRLRVTGRAAPLLVVAARTCFLGLSKTQLTRLMKYQGVAAKGGSLYGILEALIKCNLGKPDAPANEDELLEIMAIRMVESVSNQNATLETFMH
ncbi:unnamed protein product, partial [Prorocentrum cordatum]